MDKTPVISVIVPVYKVEEYLPRCIDSILSQEFTDFELLLIDDGSPDGSGKICDEYAAKDNRIRVFHKENGGVSSARNLGLDNACGEWIMFVDADDWLAKDTMKLSIQDSYGYDIVRFGYTSVFDTDFTQTKDSVLQSADYGTYLKLVAERKTTMAVWGAIYKKVLFTNNNIYFDTSLRVGEDWLVLVNLIIKSKDIKILPIPLYFYNRYNELGCMNSFNISKSKELLKALYKIKDLLGNSSQNHKISLPAAHITILNEILTTFIESKIPAETFLLYLKELGEVHPHPTIKEYISAHIPVKEKMRLFLCMHYTLVYKLLTK